MTKAFFYFLCAVCFHICTQAQTSWDKLKLINTIDLKSQCIATDKLGNLYVIANEEIHKYDSFGKLLQKNSIKSLGNLNHLDVSNPMKILAFYKDYNKIQFLDNMLAQSDNIIDLAVLGFDQATLAATSHDNGLWIYNSINFELVRLEPDLKVSHQSGNLAQLTGNTIKPFALFETNNRVYLCDSVFGIMVFDVFATYIKSVPIISIIDLQIENNMVYFINNKGFGSFNLELLQENEIPLLDKEIKQIRLQKNRVYMRSNQKIAIYTN